MKSIEYITKKKRVTIFVDDADYDEIKRLIDYKTVTIINNRIYYRCLSQTVHSYYRQEQLVKKLHKVDKRHLVKYKDNNPFNITKENIVVISSSKNRTDISKQTKINNLKKILEEVKQPDDSVHKILTDEEICSFLCVCYKCYNCNRCNSCKEIGYKIPQVYCINKKSK